MKTTKKKMARCSCIALFGEWLSFAGLVACLVALVAPALAQPLMLTAEQDLQRTMDLLHIPVLRQGANGSDPAAPNAANYDEKFANPYPHLPDPLLTNNRQPVTTANAWWQVRRPELVELFDREVYGRVPENLPAVSWIVSSQTEVIIAGHPAIQKILIGTVDNTTYPQIKVELNAILVVPAAINKPVPVIMQLIAGRFLDLNQERAQDADSWQAQILERGWAYAYFDTGSVQADNGAGLTQGIIGLANHGQGRSSDAWGVLRAWAWGASRLLDYFAQDASLAANQVGIEGHSRWGKAAMVAMAYDQRFSIAYISSSGAGGTKLHRRNYGELVENVAAVNEYHWMAGNYLKYASTLTWDDLPVDSHELISLSAPRPVFIGAGNEGDQWVDPPGMFMAAVAAEPVYNLLGAKGLGSASYPALETSLLTGELAFRQHAEGHTDHPNWPVFLEYAARYW